MAEGSSKEIAEKLYHAELINKLLQAENEELKSVIKECRKVPITKKKRSFKEKISGTFLYRALRKIKRFIMKGKK